jgi:hypothetical protein
MVAHTGIAATLLINGSTVHRQFCIPIATTGESSCKVAPDSEWEDRIKEADVIIWDEACMSDRRVICFSYKPSSVVHSLSYSEESHFLKVLQCVEKFLCELHPTSQQAFGGKLVLLGGDWKQLLPVVRSTYGLGILDYTLKKSYLWEKFEVLG